MSDTRFEDVPDGFVQLPEGLGFSDYLQPSYRRVEGDAISFGIVVQAQHGNTMGICHGGVIMTLADIAAANGVNVKRGAYRPCPTINLAVDFVAAARIGQWLQADIQLVSLKRRFAFSSGSISNADGVVARFNGTFYLPHHDGMVKPGAIAGGATAYAGE